MGHRLKIKNKIQSPIACCLLPVAYCLIFIVSLSFAAAQKGDGALSKLMDGNRRFISGSMAAKDTGIARRKETSKAQHPSAIIVACSDSQVAPEIIFDQGLGDLFVVRSAGNVLDPILVGSIEYAAEHLHVPLLILLGHDKCEAVSAALEAKEKTEDNIWTILRKILPAAKKAAARGGTKEDLLNNAVRENVLLQQKYLLRKSTIVRKLIASGDLKVVAGVYHPESGMIELFNAP
ncbi:MAG TPA: carbonic anhydrase [Dissulfurispiraceae bacterium]|nr:carbonic anhydrase [Dissulfurispiraceae bacterium]